MKAEEKEDIDEVDTKDDSQDDSDPELSSSQASGDEGDEEQNDALQDSPENVVDDIVPELRRKTRKSIAGEDQGPLANMRKGHEEHFWLSFSVLIIGIGLMIGISCAAWLGKGSRFVMGPFSLAAQVNYTAADQLLRFRRAALQAQSTVTRPSVTTSSSSFVWRRLILTYEIIGADVVSGTGLQKIKDVEKSLRALSSWQQLCGEVAVTYKSLCSPGDTMVNPVFASSGPINSVDQGIISNLTFDGLGSTVAIQPNSLIVNLPLRSPGSASRWLPSDLKGKEGLQSLRSSFSFALSTASAGQPWQDMIMKDVIPTLQQLGYMDFFSKDGKFRVYVTADAVDQIQETEFQSALLAEATLLAAGPVSAFFGAYIVSRRFFAALITGVLTVTAVSMVSIGLLAVADEPGGIPKLSVMATVAWLCITMGVTDLCVAISNAAEDRGESSRPLLPQFLLAGIINHFWFGSNAGAHHNDDFEGKLYEGLDQMSLLVDEPRGTLLLAVKAVRMLNEAVSPTLCMGVTLCFASVVTAELKAVSQFTLHAGLGFLVAIPWAVVLVPLAVEVGDVLAFRAVQKNYIDEFDLPDAMKTLVETVFPVEVFGFIPAWRSELQEKFLKYYRLSLKSITIRLLCFAGVVSVVLSLIFVPDAIPTYTHDTPELFRLGHRLRDWPKLTALFAPLGDPSLPLLDSVQGARFCKPWVQDTSECIWHKCEVPTTTSSKVSENTCRCYYQEDSVPGGVCMKGTARVWGMNLLQAQALFSDSDHFWNLTGARLSRTFATDSVARPPFVPISQLEYEDWQSGKYDARGGYSTSRGAASWDQSCVRIICSCGSSQCSLPGSFVYLNDFVLSSASSNASSTNASAAPGTQDVIVAFGVEVSKEPLQKAQDGTLRDDTGVSFLDFRLEDPDAQRSLLSFCQGTAPDMDYFAQSCWPIELKHWVAKVGLSYPLDPSYFYSRLWAYFEDWASSQTVPRPPALSDRPAGGQYFSLYPGFWVGHDNMVKGFFHIFRIAKNASREEWEDYYLYRNHSLPSSLGKAFLVPPDSVLADSVAHGEERVKKIVQSLVLLLHFLPVLWVLFLTWSFGLGICVFAIQAFNLGALDLCTVATRVFEVGVIEIASLTAFMTIISLALLRVAQQLAWTQNGPGKDPSRHSKKLLRKVAKMNLLLGGGATGHVQQPRKSHFDVPLLSSMAQKLTTRQAKVLKARMNVLKGPQLFLGGIFNERLARSITAIYRALPPILAMVITSVGTGPVLMGTGMAAMAEVCLFLLMASLVSLLMSTTLFPVLSVHCSLGPSRVKGKAYTYVFLWLRYNRPFPNLVQGIEGEFNPDVGELGSVSAQILGFPFTLLRPKASVTDRPSSVIVPSILGMEVEDEDSGPIIRSLDIHQATAMPPFHVVTAVKGKFNNAG